MKKKRVALLLLLLLFIVYLIFLFSFPSKYINIQNEFTLTKAIASILSKIPYLEKISLLLINKYSLLAVFFFILGFLYGKKSATIFFIFIIFSVVMYFLFMKANAFIKFNYGLKEFFPLCFSLFTFFYFSQEKNDRLNYFLIFFMFFSLLNAIFSKSIIISGIITGFLLSLFLGKLILKLRKLLF